MRVDRESGDASRPYADLLPLVEGLLAAGNAYVDGGFIQNPDGWRCRLARPIDFALLRRSFVVPESVLLSSAHDTVVDKRTWCSIEGPGAHRRLE